MHNIIKAFLVGLSLSLSACAFGPLVSHETAETVGEGKNELSGGYGSPGYAFKWNYGLSKNLDFGVQYGSLSLGLRAKYAFKQAPQGLSLAGAVGTGTSLGGSHTYADLMGSYAAGDWEPYSTVRFVRVWTDPIEARNTSSNDVAFRIDSAQYDYGQVMLGARYWFVNHWAISLEASTFFAISSGVKMTDGGLVSFAFVYRS